MGGVSEKGRRNLNLVDKSALGEPTYEQVGGNPRLLYFRDLKRVLNGLGDDAIYGLLRSGEIPARKIGGKWVTTPKPSRTGLIPSPMALMILRLRIIRRWIYGVDLEGTTRRLSGQMLSR